MLSIDVDEVNRSAPTRRRSPLRAALDLAFVRPTVVADDVMRVTGATRATALASVDELVRLGWIVELPRASAAGRGGRPARRFALEASRHVVVGIDAGAHRMLAIACDLGGVELGRATAELDVDAPVETRRSVAAEVATAALAGLERPRAVCLGVPAPVDEHGCSPEVGGAFWQRMNVGAASMLPLADLVLVDNDANLAATAEGATGEGAGVGAFAALLAGTRFGAGLVVDGRLLRGHGGMAGELGFLDHVQGVGSSDGLGLVAESLARAALDAGSPPLLGGHPALDGVEVLRAAGHGDPVALGIVDALAERLARIAMVLADAVGVRRVIVSGDLPPHVDLVLERARVALGRIAIGEAPSLVGSTLGRDAVAIGAVRRAIDAVRQAAL